MQYTITDYDLHIYDSYKVKKRDFCPKLHMIKEVEPNYLVWNRGIPQMCLEWAVHNACWWLHIKRSSTADVDLDYPQSFLERAFYAVGGVIVWLFIP